MPTAPLVTPGKCLGILFKLLSLERDSRSWMEPCFHQERSRSRRLRGGRSEVTRLQIALCCFAVVWMASASRASAQGAWDMLNLAQVAPAPKRALPIPNKPVSIEEADKAARINNWTVGLAGGLLEGTFSKIGRASCRERV